MYREIAQRGTWEGYARGVGEYVVIPVKNKKTRRIYWIQ